MPMALLPHHDFGSGDRLTGDFQAGQIISGLDLGLSQEVLTCQEADC